MNNADLEKIVAIAEEGNMSQAAQRLYLTQPALSRALARAEEELGERLFTRGPMGITPTPACLFLLDKARDILHLHEEIAIGFSRLNTLRGGVLNVGSTARAGGMALPYALKRFHELYPDVRINVIEGDGKLIEQRILSGALDMAVIMLPVRNSAIQFRVFNREPYLVAVPASHPLNDQALRRKDGELYLPEHLLRGQPFILASRNRRPRQQIEPLLARLGDYSTVLETSNIVTALRYVGQGFGIAVVPGSFRQTCADPNLINFYRMEDHTEVFEEWAAIFCEGEDNLTRPSRELLRILCKSPGLFSTRV